jgi:hypothetical protein
MITYASITNAEFAGYCFWTEKVNWQLPDYYCWKLTINGILIFAWVGVSKLDVPWVFKVRGYAVSRRNAILPCNVSIQAVSGLNPQNNWWCFKWSNQDKELWSSQLEKMASENGYNKFHELKDDFWLNSNWDAFKNIDGEVYFKAKTLNWSSFEPVFTGFTIK